MTKYRNPSHSGKHAFGAVRHFSIFFLLSKYFLQCALLKQDVTCINVFQTCPTKIFLEIAITSLTLGFSPLSIPAALPSFPSLFFSLCYSFLCLFLLLHPFLDLNNLACLLFFVIIDRILPVALWLCLFLSFLFLFN